MHSITRPKLFLLFIAFLLAKSYGQNQYIRDFEKLGILDTIHSQEKINLLKNESSLVFENGFVSVWRAKDGEDLKVLIKPEHTYWLVIGFPFEDGDDLHSSFEINGLTENRKYLLGSTYYSFVGHGAGGGNETGQKQLVIMDMDNNSFVSLDTYDYELQWQFEEGSENQTSQSTLDMANIVVDNNKVTILNNCFEDRELKPCGDAGGVYEIRDQKLIKTKYYNPQKKQMRAVKHIGNLALGMTIEDLSSIYPNSNPVLTGNKYGTCPDTDGVLGYEISNGDELLCFVTTEDNLIYSFLALSPSFSFGKITINSTAEEIMQFYPKAKWRIDAANNWEHAYIEELDAEVTFETNASNRVGIYKSDKKSGAIIFKKLNRKDAKPNFIEVK